MAECATVAGAGVLPLSAARTCFGADAAGAAVVGVCRGVIGVVTELVEGGWVFAFGAVMTGCVAAEGMDAEAIALETT